MIRARCTLLVLLVAAIGLSGCGRSAPAPMPTAEGSASTSSASSTTTETSSSVGLGEPLHAVGTMTISGEGTTIRASYRIGPIVYSTTGTPPVEVLEACNMNYTSEIPKLAFARGEVGVSYTHGSLPIFVEVAPNGLVSGGRTALSVEGQWECGEGEQHPGETLHPGESEHYEMWVLAQVLSNAHPRLTPAMSAKWRFESGAIAPGATGPNSTITASGSNARTCESEGVPEAVLFLYPTSGSCGVNG